MNIHISFTVIKHYFFCMSLLLYIHASGIPEIKAYYFCTHTFGRENVAIYITK